MFTTESVTNTFLSYFPVQITVSYIFFMEETDQDISQYHNKKVHKNYPLVYKYVKHKIYGL